MAPVAKLSIPLDSTAGGQSLATHCLIHRLFFTRAARM